MTDPSALEMIAELKQAQSELINDNQNESEHLAYDDLSGLNLDPITNDEIDAVENREICCSKFNADGYNKILRAKEEGTLIEFASVLPLPRERAEILAANARVNNSDTWARYVYRAANGIPDNHVLGEEFQDFRSRLKTKARKKDQAVSLSRHSEQTIDPANGQHSNVARQKIEEFAQIMERNSLDRASYNQAVEILDWFKSDGMSAEKYQICLNEIKRFR
jgi:hypothetical protein